MKSKIVCGSTVIVLALGLLSPAAMAQDKSQGKPAETVTAKAEPPETAAKTEAQTEAKRITANPFAAMAGTWSGGGFISLSSGGRERLHCRAHHTAGQGANSLSLNIRCASDSYKFELSSNVSENGGQISGNWIEAGYGVSGSINGRLEGNHITGVAEAAGYTADIAMTTNGNRQSVSIALHNVFIKDVQIALSRR